jgi:hypothetical protein
MKLFFKILELVLPAHPRRTHHTERQRNYHLRTLALVCRSWRAWPQHELFISPYTISPFRLLRFHAAVELNPSLARTVRKLSIEWKGTGDAEYPEDSNMRGMDEVLLACTELEELMVSGGPELKMRLGSQVLPNALSEFARALLQPPPFAR